MTIYFIEDGDAVKIGFTKDANPKNRIRSIQTGNPKKLTLLGFVPGTIQDERRIHNDLKDYRLEGEWFSFATPVISYIEQYMKQNGIKKTIRPRASKAKGFSSCKVSGRLTKAQQRQLLESESRLTFVDTPSGTIVGVTSDMKNALSQGTWMDLDCIKINEKETQTKNGITEWSLLLNNWLYFSTLPSSAQQQCVSAIIDDVYPTVQKLLLDTSQDSSTRFDLVPLLPVIRLAKLANEKAIITLDAYSKQTYLSQSCQSIADRMADHGTFPLAIGAGKDKKGHERFIFTPIIDEQMTWLGWQQ